jgi:transposase
LHYEQGYSIKKICQLLNIKKTLAYETLKLYQKFGVPYNPHARQQGLCPHCLTTTDLSFIHALLDPRHTVYLDEIQEQLLSRCGVKVSISTLMHTLRQLHFTNKDILGKALKHNDCDHVIYIHIAELVPNPDMFMTRQAKMRGHLTDAGAGLGEAHDVFRGNILCGARGFQFSLSLHLMVSSHMILSKVR